MFLEVPTPWKEGKLEGSKSIAPQVAANILFLDLGTDYTDVFS